MTLLLNPAILSLVIDLFLGRFSAFNLEQKFYYIVSFVGTATWWMFLAWLFRAPNSLRNRIAAVVISTLYALSFILVYGYRITSGTMPNYYTFEYLFTEPYNSWTMIRDSWTWPYAFVLIVIVGGFWIGFNKWRAYLAARCQLRRHAIIAAVNLTLALTIQLVIHNNIRFIDQCFTADLTMSTCVLRNAYTRLVDPNAGRSGLSARLPVSLPDLSTQVTHLPSGRPMNVLILLNESVRADELGLYGYSRNTTPHLDALVTDIANVVICRDAFTASTMTFVSVPCLVTGVAAITAARDFHTQPMYWEYFKAAGYQTFFMTSQSQQWHNIHIYFNVPAIDLTFNMESTGLGDDNDLGVDDHFVVDHFLDWLPKRDSTKPFAGLIQFNQTHFPYPTDKDNRPFGESERRDLYDNALHYVDQQIYRVIEGLKAAGIYDQTLIVLTSDHGEGFKEHGLFGHLNCQYREGIHVPLIWFIPPALVQDSAWSEEMTNLRVASVDRNVSNLDILPTLLDFGSIWNTSGMGSYSSGFAGASLLRPIPRDRALICSNLTETSRRQRGLSVVIDNWHYILDLQGERAVTEELFDWSVDPGESNNIIATIPPDLRNRISEFLDSYPVSQRVRKSLTTD